MKILHKAKRKDNGEWVEGYYCQLPKISLGATIIANGEMCAEDVADYIIEIKDKQNRNFSNGFPFQVVEREIYEVDPETVCVYIGKDDGKDNKIWEHDVIFIDTYDYMEPEEDFFGEVVYCDACACWCIKEPGSEKPIPLCECEGSYKTVIEVVGNVFDNPELLERR